MTSEKSPVVFFIDDEPSVLKSIIRLTQGAPYEVFTFDDPQKAIAEFEKHEVAVVVSDQMMPSMKGTTCLAMVREEWPETIRMIFSGFTDFESILPAINYGKIFHFIAKPWNDDELLAAINDAISQYNLIQENKRLTDLTQKQNQELIEMNRNLEKMVEERTKELSETVEKLSIEMASRNQNEK